MKTKITTIIGLVTLGIIGFANTNTTAANNYMNLVESVATEQNLAIEEWMLDSNLWIESSEVKTENVETKNDLVTDAWITEEDFFKAAESFTAAGSDSEIEKYAIKQIENAAVKGETVNNLEDFASFFKDAESYTAAGSDKEIEKYADKQMALEYGKEIK